MKIIKNYKKVTSNKITKKNLILLQEKLYSGIFHQIHFPDQFRKSLRKDSMNMDRTKYLIVMAGGSGTRMGAPVPKQFMSLDGAPVMQKTIWRFVQAVPDIKIVTVLPAEYVQMWKDLCYKYSFDVPQTIVHGGLTRFHSVRNGLVKVPEGAVVAVHDGVRPFVSPGLVEKLFRMAGGLPAVVPAVPCTDTLRPVARDAAGELVRLASEPPVDRSRVYAVQTPQVFWSEVLKNAYGQAYDTSFTDDASVVEKAGVEVVYTDGERNNIKLTTPEDMRLAEALCRILDY